MHIVEGFMTYWNRLARRNQKIKFRNSREAAEFVRHLVRTSEPNREMVKMREQYVAVQEARRRAQESGLDQGADRTVRHSRARHEPLRLRGQAA